MKYRIKRETKPKLSTFGKYKAVATHLNTVSSFDIIQEASKDRPYDSATIIGVITRLSQVISDHLRRGDRVRLSGWGLMKLEIESDKVDNLQDFSAEKHIRGVRLHFIPESLNGTQALYDGITFEKEQLPI